MKTKIGVTTSSFGLESPAHAMQRADSLGFDYIQLSGIDYFLRQNPCHGRTNAVNFIKANEGRVYSISVPLAVPEKWAEEIKNAFFVASQSRVKILSGHAVNKGTKYNAVYLAAVLRGLKNAGIRFAVETGTESPQELYAALQQLDPSVGVSFDLANFLINRTATLEQALSSLRIPEFAERIFQVHIKDAVEGEERILGKGNVDVKRYIHAVQQAGYTGPLILETGGDLKERYNKTVESKKALDKILEGL